MILGDKVMPGKLHLSNAYAHSLMFGHKMMSKMLNKKTTPFKVVMRYIISA